MTYAHCGHVHEAKGVWERRQISQSVTEPRVKTAALSCPNCGQAASLIDHDIASDGTVSPSVVCPMAECGFHDMVQLIGWS